MLLLAALRDPQALLMPQTARMRLLTSQPARPAILAALAIPSEAGRWRTDAASHVTRLPQLVTSGGIRRIVEPWLIAAGSAAVAPAPVLMGIDLLTTVEN